jgi:SAM-dependent methyltransferase
MCEENMSKENPNLHYGRMYDEDKYVRIRYEQYIRLLEPHIGRLKKNNSAVSILDIGGYTAELKRYLSPDVEYTLVDFDDEALEIARQRGAQVKKFNLDNDSLSILNRKFDIIVATEVLEHLKNPEKYLQEMQALLKKDGVVLISFPNENMIYHRLMSLFGYGVDMCAFELYKHLHLPTVAQSEKFVCTYFKILEKDYYINPSAKESRSEWLGSILTIFPDTFWAFLARTFPGLFARGVMFLAKNY